MKPSDMAAAAKITDTRIYATSSIFSPFATIRSASSAPVRTIGAIWSGKIAGSGGRLPALGVSDREEVADRRLALGDAVEVAHRLATMRPARGCGDSFSTDQAWLGSECCNIG